jgi:CheY-like chemotaxis protein
VSVVDPVRAVGDAQERREAGLSTEDESQYILVVDDDESICELIAEILMDEGYEVASVRDAGRALEMVAKRPPALILLDLSVAEQSADELVAAIRRLPGRAASIIVVSAHANVGERAEQVGADGYLPKPFDIPILVDTVQAIVSVRPSEGRDGTCMPEAG